MSLGAQLLIAGLVCGVLGFLFGWLYGRGRAAAPADDRLANELRQQLTQREAELKLEREQLSSANTLRATADAQKSAAEKLLATPRRPSVRLPG